MSPIRTRNQIANSQVITKTTATTVIKSTGSISVTSPSVRISNSGIISIPVNKTTIYTLHFKMLVLCQA